MRGSNPELHRQRAKLMNRVFALADQLGIDDYELGGMLKSTPYTLATWRSGDRVPTHKRVLDQLPGLIEKLEARVKQEQQGELPLRDAGIMMMVDRHSLAVSVTWERVLPHLGDDDLTALQQALVVERNRRLGKESNRG